MQCITTLTTGVMFTKHLFYHTIAYSRTMRMSLDSSFKLLCGPCIYWLLVFVPPFFCISSFLVLRLHANICHSLGMVESRSCILFMSNGNVFFTLFIMPIVFAILFAVLSVWLLQLICLFIVTPRNTTLSTNSIVISLISRFG